MASRLDLQSKLESLMTEFGFSSDEVYFQPPPDYEISYPCVVYRETSHESLNGNDTKYIIFKSYKIQVISRTKDDIISMIETLEKWPYCSFGGFFISDNLNHWNFTLYF